MNSGVQSRVNSLNPVGGELTRTSVFINWAKSFISFISKKFPAIAHIFFIKFKTLLPRLFKFILSFFKSSFTKTYKVLGWLGQLRARKKPDHIQLSTIATTEKPKQVESDNFNLAKWRASLVEVANKPMEHKHVAIDIPPKGDGRIVPRNAIATLPHGVFKTNLATVEVTPQHEEKNELTQLLANGLGVSFQQGLCQSWKDGSLWCMTKYKPVAKKVRPVNQPIPQLLNPPLQRPPLSRDPYKHRNLNRQRR